MHSYEFGYVTRFINIVNLGSNIGDRLAVSFTRRGLTVGNYFTLGQGDALREELRLTTLHISCSAGTSVDYQLLCGLTNIPARNFLQITGSNGHQGVG